MVKEKEENREKKININQRAKYRKRKNPIHLFLNLVVNDHQLGLGGRKVGGGGDAHPGSHLQVRLHVNIATFVRK